MQISDAFMVILFNCLHAFFFGSKQNLSSFTPYTLINKKDKRKSFINACRPERVFPELYLLLGTLEDGTETFINEIDTPETFGGLPETKP